MRIHNQNFTAPVVSTQSLALTRLKEHENVLEHVNGVEVDVDAFVDRVVLRVVLGLMDNLLSVIHDEARKERHAPVHHLWNTREFREGKGGINKYFVRSSPHSP